MSTLRVSVLFALVAAGLFLAPLASSDEAPAGQAAPGQAAPAKAEARPPVASDEEVAEALVRFKDEYRAKGLKGDDKTSQRDFALENLSSVQHPEVVKALAKIARGHDETLRYLAIIYLGEQKAVPGLAGAEILRVLKRHGKKDPVLAMSALDSLGRLRYLGAKKEIGDLLNHQSFAVKKAAIQAIGKIGDARLWREVLKLAGVTVKEGDGEAGVDQAGGKEEVVDEGYSYDGVEVHYDSGSSGDGDQKMAEKLGKEKLAANKAAATGGRGGGMGGGGGSGGGTATRGGVARNPKELLPAVLETLFKLTDERFGNSREVAQWVMKHRDAIKDKVKETEVLAKDQKAEAKEQKKR